MKKMVWIYVFLLLGCLFTATRCDQGTQICPDGWTSGVGICFKFVTDRRVTWFEAVEECNRYDAGLLKIEYQDELTWIQNHVFNHTEVSYWTAMNNLVHGDGLHPGVWMWGQYEYVDMSLIHWSSHPAPDGTGGCGGLTIAGMMSDVDCSSRQGYICNMKRANGDSCPSQWIQTVTDCYFISNTTDPSQLVTWASAKQMCSVMTSSGSHLVTIDDVNDRNVISRTFPSLPGTTYLYWTGLYYNQGSWHWSEGTVYNTQFFNWTKEPDNLSGSEHCGVIRYQGTFSDRGCNSSHPFICRKSAISVTDVTNHGCGEWSRAGNTCYKFFPDAASTWIDAKKACQQIHGYLMSVKDPDTKVWLQLQMLDAKNDRSMWVSLNDRDREGSYLWADNTPIDTNILSWNQEPNDLRGGEDCAVIQNNGQYVDRPCDTRAAAICELDSSAQGCPKVGQWQTRPVDVGQGVNCYMFGNYSNQWQIFTQAEVHTFCRTFALSASLVPHPLVVDSHEEKTYIKQQLSTLPFSPDGFWTGLTDKDQEGMWRFDGQAALIDQSLIDWTGGPNNSTPDADCGYVMYNAYLSIGTCGSTLGYICERSTYQQVSGAFESAIDYKLVSLLFWFAMLVFHET